MMLKSLQMKRDKSIFFTQPFCSGQPWVVAFWWVCPAQHGILLLWEWHQWLTNLIY
jgi:hypothetical protein